jgi:hypothetical protein
MALRRYTYRRWLADRAESEAWCATVDRAMPRFERVKPRDPDEASLLRAMGTPQSLIGPRQPGYEQPVFVPQSRHV